MKIMVQDRDAVIDVTKADIYTDDDGVYEYVVAVKNGKKYTLGGYVEQGKAAKEFLNFHLQQCSRCYFDS